MDIGGKQVELQVRRSKRVRGHRMVVRQGLPPELVVRPRATPAQIYEAIDFHRSWLASQLAKVTEPRLGLDRLRLTEEQGRTEARARITLLAQSEAAALGVTYSRITMRNQRSHCSRPRSKRRMLVLRGSQRSTRTVWTSSALLSRWLPIRI